MSDKSVQKKKHILDTARKVFQEKGYKQVMEEVAYTWFNRFIALRFMEVNNYLPSHIRVFSDASGAFKPEILNDVLHLDLPGLDSGKVAEYIESNDTDALYRYLLLTQCNALNSALPVMFERMGGYTEMLLPNNILRQDSVLGHMVSDIPEEDWQDAVQIIGWLYQYYNTELKDDTFAQLKKNVKITKERIPAATQLFTPNCGAAGNTIWMKPIRSRRWKRSLPSSVRNTRLSNRKRSRSSTPAWAAVISLSMPSMC